MNKKKFILIGIIFCMTGCNINYNLEIVDDEYKENISAVETDSTKWNSSQSSLPMKDLLDVYLKKPIPISNQEPLRPESDEISEGITYYDKKDLSNDEKIGIRLEGTFNKETYSNSRAVLYGYNRFLIGTLNGNIVLSTGEKVKIFEQYKDLEEITVKIKTNHVVVKNNADEVDGETYIWHLTKDNALNKSIYFEFNKQEKVSNYDNEIGKLIFKIVIVIAVVAVVIGIFILWLKIKQKRVNKL